MAQLSAIELDGVDASNLADFFRISPWEADDLQLALLKTARPPRDSPVEDTSATMPGIKLTLQANGGRELGS